MAVSSAKFVISNTDHRKCPSEKLPEFAFIGRSNVGKSSLINAITGHSKLAKTSQRPGKTQLINHFIINEEWFLVDLPGYGFAKVSKEQRHKFTEMISEYLLNREQLQCVFVLIDSRLPPQPIDLEFLQWLGEVQVPFVMVFTKADKQSKNKTASSIALYNRVMRQKWEELPMQFVTSAITQEGCAEILQYIEFINKEIKNNTK
ncbi:ribosome biogenesis GTP-binding protein YihA/YsxC [Eisenibacter elegans]|uniref:ribosome biogenesis GTP-binding protein YihA/YsxC n=1 Tax=Eisenibacter elegans TaxID=997 RepID=UPI00041BC8FE|nr:ribosome biogenesis GTP-binding protein YihA/YsxC [Eisenibacter elegans]